MQLQIGLRQHHCECKWFAVTISDNFRDSADALFRLQSQGVFGEAEQNKETPASWGDRRQGCVENEWGGELRSAPDAFRRREKSAGGGAKGIGEEVPRRQRLPGWPLRRETRAGVDQVEQEPGADERQWDRDEQSPQLLPGLSGLGEEGHSAAPFFIGVSHGPVGLAVIERRVFCFPVRRCSVIYPAADRNAMNKT